MDGGAGRARQRRARAAPTRSSALALGATAVGIGRPYAYGLAVGEDRAFAEVVRNHLAEFDVTMALTGCRTLADVTRERLVPAP